MCPTNVQLLRLVHTLSRGCSMLNIHRSFLDHEPGLRNTIFKRDTLPDHKCRNKKTCWNDNSDNRTKSYRWLATYVMITLAYRGHLKRASVGAVPHQWLLVPGRKVGRQGSWRPVWRWMDVRTGRSPTCGPRGRGPGRGCGTGTRGSAASAVVASKKVDQTFRNVLKI